MRLRCYKPKSTSWRYYGAKGISVCEDWHDFAKFVVWARRKGWEPHKGLSLEREDNAKNYEPDNCKWIPKAQQARNKTTVPLFEHEGQMMTPSELSLHLGLYKHAIAQRLRRGWTLEQAMARDRKRGPQRQ